MGICDTHEWSFFSMIQFLSLEFQFHFEMCNFCCFQFVLLQIHQRACYYSYYGYYWRLKLVFSRNCWVYVEDLCFFFFLIQLRMTVCNVRFFFFLCEWFLRFLPKEIWFLGVNFRLLNFFVSLCCKCFLLSSSFLSSAERIFSC